LMLTVGKRIFTAYKDYTGLPSSLWIWFVCRH
jgi:hypothetical protein